MKKFNYSQNIMNIKAFIKSKREWDRAVSWAKKAHPNWAHLATQMKRPEIRETYRKKILREYCDVCL